MIIIKKIPAYRLRKEIVSKIETCGYRVDDKNVTWFVVYVDKKYAGFAGSWKMSGTVHYFGPTYIKEEFRGQGLQRKLIEKRLKFAKTLGSDKVWSRVDLSNIISARNLIKCGFNLEKPKQVGMIEGGNLSVTIDDKEILSVAPTELFFSKEI